MAEKKAGAKKVSKKSASGRKKTDAKKEETKKTDSVRIKTDSETVKTKKSEFKRGKGSAKEVEAKAIKENKSEIEAGETEQKKEKKCCGSVILAVIITFLVTAILFGVAFFVFMNLEVIDDEGRVRIEHGRIYVDSREKQCNEESTSTSDDDKKDEADIKKESSGDDKTEKKPDGTGDLTTNPNPRVGVKDATLIEVGDFEVFLPKEFAAAKGNGNGKYTYNLTDDSGWADVKVYAEKTAEDVLIYMSKKDSLLKLSDSTYYLNGANWVEMKSGTSLAYGTRLGDMIYVIMLNVKIESDVTDEAEQMIPKTLRLKRIYK